MNADLESYRLQLLSIRQDVPGVWNGLSDTQFNWKADPAKWSIGECFAHLNQTAKRTIPILDEMIARGRAKGWTGHGPFALGLVERTFVKSLEPPPRLRAKAPKRLQPVVAGTLSVSEVSREFLAWQEALDERIGLSDGLDLLRVKGPSPAVPLVRWSLSAMFAVTLAHERRHVWQAREVRKHPGFPR